MYIILVNWHVLFELTKKLALESGLPLAHTSDPTMFMSNDLQELLSGEDLPPLNSVMG